MINERRKEKRGKGGQIMASNFTMRFQRKNGKLHIQLNGDFDGSSAHVLLNALKRNHHEKRNIFVDTSGLKKVFPFGREVLRCHLSALGFKPGSIVFSGEHAASLSP
jgi:hypothetical protein